MRRMWPFGRMIWTARVLGLHEASAVVKETVWRGPAGVTVVYSEGGAFVRFPSCRNR